MIIHLPLTKLSFMFACRLVSQDDRRGVAPRPLLPGQLPVGGALSSHSQYHTVLTIDCYLTLKYVRIHSQCQQVASGSVCFLTEYLE